MYKKVDFRWSNLCWTDTSALLAYYIIIPIGEKLKTSNMNTLNILKRYFRFYNKSVFVLMSINLILENTIHWYVDHLLTEYQSDFQAILIKMKKTILYQLLQKKEKRKTKIRIQNPSTNWINFYSKWQM